MDTLKLYINGEWTEGHSGTFIQVENPATKEIFTQVPEGDVEDVECAVAAAVAAFPIWSQLTAEERAGYLDKIADFYEENVDEIADIITAELGAPKKMSRTWHVQDTIDEARLYANIARGFKYESAFSGFIIRREPVGVVAALTPWNYPLGQVAVKVLPALAAGNCVVLKPSQQAPLAAYFLARAVEAAGIPKGVFNLVTGRGADVGKLLAAHEAIRMVSFTGSTEAGREVGCLGLGNIKKLALELGGKSAMVLLRNGDMKKAVDFTFSKCFMNTGQTCSALTRLIVPRELKEELEAYIKESISFYVVGDPVDENTDIGPLINERSFRKVSEYIRIWLNEGARMIAGALPESCGNGYYVRPTVFADVTEEMTIVKEEIFGPVLSVIYYDTEEDALRITNNSEYGLSGAVFGEHNEALAFAEKMETGGVYVNGAPFVLQSPFGGYKRSGIGREFGEHGFDEYLETKEIYVV